MEKSRQQEIINEVLNMKSTDEINELARELNRAFKLTRKNLNDKKKFEFMAGDKVVITTQKNGIEYGEIEKVRRSKAEVSINGTTFLVPFSIMELSKVHRDNFIN